MRPGGMKKTGFSLVKDRSQLAAHITAIAIVSIVCKANLKNVRRNSGRDNFKLHDLKPTF